MIKQEKTNSRVAQGSQESVQIHTYRYIPMGIQCYGQIVRTHQKKTKQKIGRVKATITGEKKKQDIVTNEHSEKPTTLSIEIIKTLLCPHTCNLE